MGVGMGPLVMSRRGRGKVSGRSRMKSEGVENIRRPQLRIIRLVCAALSY